MGKETDLGEMDKIWGQAREELQRIVGADSFATWIDPLKLAEVDDGTAVIACPTRFLSDWVSRHYSDDILTVLSGTLPEESTGGGTSRYPAGRAVSGEHGRGGVVHGELRPGRLGGPRPARLPVGRGRGRGGAGHARLRPVHGAAPGRPGPR